MIDPCDAILDAFYNTLNGNLSYDSNNWPYKTFGEISQSNDCAILQDITVEDDGDEDIRITMCNVLIDVKEGSKKYGSWKATNTVSNQIIELLAYKEISFTGFRLCTPITYTSNLLSEYLPEGEIIHRKLIRFNFRLEEL